MLFQVIFYQTDIWSPLTFVLFLKPFYDCMSSIKLVDFLVYYCHLTNFLIVLSYSGMTLAVVAILGHFSKTLLLFFIPQVANFIYSLPQLFHQIPCPRHRLPKYNEDTDLREMSTVIFKSSDMKTLGKIALYIFKGLKLVTVRQFDKDGQDYIECNNLTIINLTLRIFGPLHERTLTIVLLLLQIVCSCLAFVIRYPLAKLFYGEVIA